MRNLTSVVFMCVFAAILSGQAPSFAPAGVVNSASLAGGPIAPREMVTIFGTGLGPNGVNICGTILTSCVGSSVLVNGTAAPIFAAGTVNGQSQLSFEAPVDLSGSTATLQVTTQVNGQTLQSAIVMVPVAAVAPGIFSYSSNGLTFGTINRTAGGNITTSNPALPGDTLTAYGTGFGKTDPVGTSGSPPPAGAQLTVPVTVTVGGLAASGVGAFPAPGFTGTDLVNFIVPPNVPAGNLPVVVTVGGQAAKSVLLPVAPPVPVINAIVNGATFKAGAHPAAANSFVSLFGLNFGADNTTGNIFPATEFKGLSVMVNGTPVPLYSVGGTGGQINIVLPSELGTSGTATVEVKTSQATSAPFQLQLTADSVGIFRIVDPSNLNRNNGAVLFSNTAWKVMPLSMAAALGFPSCASVTTASECGKPAKVGDQIQIYLTGLGKATPNGDPNGNVLATGSLAPTDGSVLYKTVETPVVKIGGVSAVVEFSGIAPGNAGQYQINVAVPDGVKPGDDVTLEVTMPDGSTDTVTIAITS